MPQPGSIDKNFIELVAKDVRGLLSEADQEKLHSPENLSRVYDALNALKKDVEVQLSNQKSRWVKKRDELNRQGDDGSGWIAFKASEADWRARAIKFLMAVEDQLSAAKARMRLRHTSPTSDSVLDLVDEVFVHMEEIGNEASPADKRVWEKARALQDGASDQ